MRSWCEYASDTSPRGDTIVRSIFSLREREESARGVGVGWCANYRTYRKFMHVARMKMMRATKRLGVRTTWSFLLRLLAVPMITVAFAPALTSSPLVVAFSCRAATSSSMSEATIPTTSLSSTSSPETIFEEFVQFILEHQSSMIHELEQIDGSGASFSLDGWEASCRSYL